MAVTLTTVQLWSEVDQAIVSWDVALEDQTPEEEFDSWVITLRHGEEVCRFSPNVTDAELLKRVSEMNGEHE